MIMFKILAPMEEDLHLYRYKQLILSKQKQNDLYIDPFMDSF